MKEKLLYSSLSALFLGLALWLQGWAWLLLWPALSCAVILAGYLGAGAVVLGKRADGSLPWWSWLVNGPYLAGFWLINAASGWFRRNVRGWADWTPVAHGIILSRFPDPAAVPPDVEVVVDLTAEYPAPAWPASIRYFALPMLDNSAPALADAVALLAQLRDEPARMLIHCAGGTGRSAMLVAALLVLRGIAPNAEAAHDYLLARRPGVNFSSEQSAFLELVLAQMKPADDWADAPLIASSRYHDALEAGAAVANNKGVDGDNAD
jgi:protein-tyrosine phosphatase